MGDQDNIERLKTTSIVELNFGTPGIRRAIQRAGFNTLPEIIGLSENK